MSLRMAFTFMNPWRTHPAIRPKSWIQGHHHIGRPCRSQKRPRLVVGVVGAVLGVRVGGEKKVRGIQRVDEETMQHGAICYK